MRINLVTPFAQKDAAKALGARWDATKKIWYIEDVADLTPFLRWIPDLQAAQDEPGRNDDQLARPTALDAVKQSTGVITASAVAAAHCGCIARAWEDCPHTAD